MLPETQTPLYLVMIKLNYTDDLNRKLISHGSVVYVPRTGHHQTGKVSPFGMHNMHKLRKYVTYTTQNVTASVLTILEVELNPKE